MGAITTESFYITGDLESTIAKVAEQLKNRGFQVNARRAEWRVLMFRKESLEWTQVYVHLTRAKVESRHLRVTGPEIASLAEVWR